MWDSDHVHRASLDAEGKTKKVALKSDAAVAMFDKAHDPTYKRTAERNPLWSGERIVNADSTGNGTKVRENLEGSLAAQLTREKTSAMLNPLHTARNTNEEELPHQRGKKTQDGEVRHVPEPEEFSENDWT